MIKIFDFENSADYTKVNSVISGGKGKLGLVNNPGQLFSEDFADDTDFDYDADKVEFIAGKLQQKAISIIEAYLQSFASDTDFTYDNTKAEFASGLVRQKSQRPNGSTFGATYNSSINGSWGNGYLVAVGYGGASVSGGRLDLSYGDARYITYEIGAGNFPNTQQGCIKFKYTPNYSGSPVGNRYILNCYTTLNVYNNTIQLYHSSTGNISLNIADSAGNNIVFGSLGAWSPASGTSYEFEINFDVTNGATRLFINGIQFGSTKTGTGTRTTMLFMRIGGSFGSDASNAFYDDLICYTLPQHTSNYTPGYSIPNADYVENIVQLPAMSYLYNIASFGAPTITEVNAPKYIVNGYYWNGAAWDASSNTYATAMTYADWVANIATFPGAQFGTSIVVKVIFQDSNTLGSVDSIGFNINETHYVASNVTLPELAYTGLGTLISFDDFTTVESGTPRYTLQIGRSGNYLYHNGAAWVTSNNTYAQANTKAQFLANISTLPVLGEIYGQFKVLFDTSNSQSYVDTLSAELTQQQYAPQGSLLTLDGFDAQSITILSSVLLESGDNKAYFVIVVDGINYYHNGTSWAVATDPYTQNNTIAQLNSHLSTLLSENKPVKMLVILKSEDGTETPEIGSLTVVYVFGGLEPLPANTARVYGYIEDLEGTPIEGATVTVEVNLEANEYCEVAGRITSSKVVKTTNDDGYFEFLLPWNSEFDTEGSVKYKLTVLKADVIDISKKSGDVIEFDIEDDTEEINLSTRIAMA
jgi:hypothetical protein